jgi:hypothetical protein
MRLIIDAVISIIGVGFIYNAFMINPYFYQYATYENICVILILFGVFNYRMFLSIQSLASFFILRNSRLQKQIHMLLAKRIVQYTMMLNVMLSIYNAYCRKQNKLISVYKYSKYDILSNAWIAWGSYQFHRTCYRYMKKHGYIAYTHSSIRNNMILDTFFIHCRCIFMNYIMNDELKYSNPLIMHTSMGLLCLHVLGFASFLWYIQNTTTFVYKVDDSSVKKSLLLTNAMVGLPTMLTLCNMIFYYTTKSPFELTYFVNGYYVIFLLAMTMIVEPLHEYTHILTHMFIIIYNVYCSHIYV